MAASDFVLSLVERKGWRATAAAGGWRLTRADAPDLAFFLSFTPSWIVLQMPLAAYLPPDLDQAGRVTLYRALLRHNEQMFMAKFALDEAGVPLLAVELPYAPHLVEAGLDALAHYATHYVALLGQPDAWDTVPAGNLAAKELFFDEPPGIPHEVIAYYVKAMEPCGWGMIARPKGITWPLGYKGERTFEAFLTVTRAWAYFQVPLLPNVPAAHPDLAVQETFLSYLLAVNQAWYAAKVGLGAADRVVMMLEVPTQQLDFDLFRTITRLLAAYLDSYAREVQIMANLQADDRLRATLANS